VTDSVNIGGTLNQPVHSYGPLAVTNNCSETGVPTGPPPHILYELDGDEEDTSGNNLDGTRSGGSYVAGKYGQALQGTDGTAVSVTAPYGEAVNPSTQSLTIVVGYEVPAGAENLTRTVAGASLGTNQRLHISTQSGTWQIAVQSSSVSVSTPSNLSVVAGWNRLCLRLDSGTNTATLTVNNTTGTGGATKAYTPYTLASDLAFGLPSGFNTSVAGGGKWDKAAIYTSLIDCNDDWLAWEPASPEASGTFTQAAWKARSLTANTLFGGSQPLKSIPSGAVGLSVQVDCTDASTACTSIGFRPWYSKTAGRISSSRIRPRQTGSPTTGLRARCTPAARLSSPARSPMPGVRPSA
jgi:hypothetical protein